MTRLLLIIYRPSKFASSFFDYSRIDTISIPHQNQYKQKFRNEKWYNLVWECCGTVKTKIMVNVSFTRQKANTHASLRTKTHHSCAFHIRWKLIWYYLVHPWLSDINYVEKCDDTIQPTTEISLVCSGFVFEYELSVWMYK